jgi:hypothetical protein
VFTARYELSPYIKQIAFRLYRVEQRPQQKNERVWCTGGMI